MEEQLKCLMEADRREEISRLRHLLHELVNAQNVDSRSVIQYCQEIRKILPDDFLAHFYEVSNSDNELEYVNLLSQVDPIDHESYLSELLTFSIRSLKPRLILPITGLIERAYKNTDMEAFDHWSSKLELEAEKVDAGIYDVDAPRDVFIAYSQKTKRNGSLL